MNSVRTGEGQKRASALINWLFAKDKAGRPYANVRRLGIMYMIWNNKIWESYRASDGWTAIREPMHPWFRASIVVNVLMPGN